MFVKLRLLAQRATEASAVEVTLTPELLADVKAQIMAQWGKMTLIEAMDAGKAIGMTVGQVAHLMRGAK